VAKSVRSPLQLDAPERRALLTAHFIGVVEALIEDGASYSDLSVERLIRAGGVSRATFYAYFQDKGDLLRAMAQDVANEISAAGEAWWTLPESLTQGDLREGLRPAVEAYLTHKILLRAVAETAAYDERVREAYEALMAETIRRLAAHIKKEQRAGLAHTGLDPARTATWLVWMLERGLYQVVSVAPELAVDGWVDSVTEIVWRTVYEGYR
jgi:TetR/AcrR family transcriptional regulator, ethionamide resistance regulator